MSTRVKIKNFQSIENVEFDINGFTVIVGKNNIGKSAIVRAINSTLTNKSGKEYIRKGKKQTEVKIQRDGIDIEWKKGDKTLYKVNGNDFSALGAGALPKPMIENGFDKMEIGEEKLSPLIASQFNELFLLDKSGSVVTQVLSNLYDIDVLSEADNLCQKELKNNKSIQKTREEDLKLLIGKLEKFKDFESIKIQVQKLAQDEQICINLQKEITQLINYEHQFTILQKVVKLLTTVRDIKIPDLSDCEKIRAEYVWLESKESELRILANGVKKLQGIKVIKIPDTEKLIVVFRETLQIIDWDNAVTDFSKKVKKLQAIDEIKIPETTLIESLVKEIPQIVLWDDVMIAFSKKIRGLKSTLESLSLDQVIKHMEETSIVVKEFETLSNLFIEFFNSATATKTARDELKRVTEDMDRVLKEKAEIKICPACERPF